MVAEGDVQEVDVGGEEGDDFVGGIDGGRGQSGLCWFDLIKLMFTCNKWKKHNLCIMSVLTYLAKCHKYLPKFNNFTFFLSNWGSVSLRGASIEPVL